MIWEISKCTIRSKTENATASIVAVQIIITRHA